MIILDTNVLSELLKSHPHPSVLAWSRAQRRKLFATTAVCEAELRFGVATLPPGQRRIALTTAIDRILNVALSGAILAFDRAAASHFATFVAARRAAGRPVEVADAMIAATALSVGADALATRNTRDFEGSGLDLLNPWHDP